MKFPPKDVRWLQRHLRCVVLEPTSTCQGNIRNRCHQYMFIGRFSLYKSLFEIITGFILTLQPSDVHFSSSSDQYKQLDWVMVNV